MKRQPVKPRQQCMFCLRMVEHISGMYEPRRDGSYAIMLTCDACRVRLAHKLLTYNQYISLLIERYQQGY